ncbi:DUF3040 domain-containing protein [Paenarthrobacter ilicis]|uniref:DUF3040 domain-containing protein n=1 Tax=Paenarthrobacter ilicis TaxID=43665 RepID=UPI00300B5251
MELSPSDKKALDTIAAGLEADDPAFAVLMSTKDLKRARRRIYLRGVVVAFWGLGLLLTSFPLGSLPLGVLGFMMMGGGSYWATLFIDDVFARLR